MSKRTFVAFVLSAMLLPAVSQAVTVINGDFEVKPGILNPVPGWTATTTGSPSSVEIINTYGSDATNLAHLSASAIFTWSGTSWQSNPNVVASADLASHFFSLGQGETTISFQALAVGQGADIQPAYVNFYGEAPSGASGSDRVAITSGDWNTYTFQLRDFNGNFLPAGSMVAVFADVLANVPSHNGTTTGQNVHMQSDLYVDNFTTTVVPEPGTMLSLLLAVAGNVVYIRRRMAA